MGLWRRHSRTAGVAGLVALVAVLVWTQVSPAPEPELPTTKAAAGTTIGTFRDLQPVPPVREEEVLGTQLTAGEVAIAPPPEQFDEPAAPAAPPPKQLQSAFAGVAPSGGTWAVVIGVNDYPGGGHDLRSAVNDANDVNEALARMGVPGDHRVLLRDSQANAATIRMSLDWLVAHAGPDAVAVFFYAGHIRSLGGGTEAIVAADGGLIRDADMAAQLSRLQARRAWIGLAACYSGGFTEVLAEGRVLTAAAPAGSLAYETDAYNRSYLVEFMVRRGMIQNAAPPTVEAAFAYARSEISRDHPRRVPVQFDSLSGELDLRPPGVARPQAQPTAAPQPASPTRPPGSGSGSGSSGSGSGSGSGGGSQQPHDGDHCANLTLGVAQCNPKD